MNKSEIIANSLKDTLLELQNNKIIHYGGAAGIEVKENEVILYLMGSKPEATGVVDEMPLDKVAAIFTATSQRSGYGFISDIVADLRSQLLQLQKHQDVWYKKILSWYPWFCRP